MLKVGIVGLPNIGKSTLFNALTHSSKAESANYPFCTIKPNIGIVAVPDKRLFRLAKMTETKKLIQAVIQVVDIAGLVSGASKGEGLGNQFLANIKEVDAIIHVVRCFENVNISHNMKDINPARDIEVITTELILADLQSVESQLRKNKKKANYKDKDTIINIALLERLFDHLNDGNAAITFPRKKEEIKKIKQFFLISDKPTIYACNISLNDLKHSEDNKYFKQIKSYTYNKNKIKSCIICAKLEAEINELSSIEAKEYFEAFGIKKSGISKLIQKSYDLLGLASYFTAGKEEVRAWTFNKGMKAPDCAGIIHTDFKEKFIKAEVISYNDLMIAGGFSSGRKLGKYRLEGKNYIFADGDIANFRFN